MNIRESAGPPRASGGGEWLLGTALALLAVSIGAADLAAGLASRLSGTGFRLVSFTAVGRFAGRLIAHPDDPAALWPGGAHFAPALFYIAFGSLVVLVLVVVIAIHRLLRPARSGAPDGFAAREELQRHASLAAGAAASRADSTVPRP